jgi:hypothetical protein
VKEEERIVNKAVGTLLLVSFDSIRLSAFF